MRDLVYKTIERSRSERSIVRKTPSGGKRMKYYCEDSQQVLQELNSQKSGLTEKEAAEQWNRRANDDKHGKV